MHDGFSLPQSRWIALLSIAHRYEFMDVRARAIREIYNPLGKRAKEKSGSNPDPDSEPLDCLALILTAEKYDVPPQQALSSFLEPVMRKDPLTEDEIARLPVHTVVERQRIRNTVRNEWCLGIIFTKGELKRSLDSSCSWLLVHRFVFTNINVYLVLYTIL